MKSEPFRADQSGNKAMMELQPPPGNTAISTQDGRPAITDESYLLRRVTEPAGERRQVCLRCIHEDEEHYFNSLRALTAYLRALR